MKSHSNRNSGRYVVLTALFGLSALFAQTAAQEIAQVQNVSPSNNASVSLPLSSVGKEVGWKIAPDDYRLAVSEKMAGNLSSLEIYSPEINKNDYLNRQNRDNYYGDEIYGKNEQVSTNITLTNRDGRTVATHKYGMGTSHAFEQLINTQLAQGYYPLNIVTNGKGKNAFGLRTSAGLAVEASQFTINARGKFNQDQLAARFTLNKNAIGQVVKVENYDADGTGEMIVTLVRPDGKRQRLTASGNEAWASEAIKVTPALVGEYAVLVRILPTTKQFSNSVAFRLRLNDQPYFARMPAFAPRPVVAAPTPAPTPSPTPTPPTPTPPTPPIAEPAKLSIDKTVDKTEVATGQTVNFKIVVANSGGSAATGVELTDVLPADLHGENLVAKFDLKPGEQKVFNVPAQVDRNDGTSINTAKVMWNKQSLQDSAEVHVQAKPVPQAAPAKLEFFKTIDKTVAKIGDKVNYTIMVKNIGGSVANDIHLTDVAPEGLYAYPLDALFALAPGEVREYTIPATITTPESEKDIVVTNTAKLEYEGKTTTSAASVTVRGVPVAAPLAMRRESTITLQGTLGNVVPNCAGYAILSDKLPAGATYLAGSSRIVTDPTQSVTQQLPRANETLADPYVSSDRLYWVLPLQKNRSIYALTYKLTHENALVMPADRVGLVLSQTCSRSAGTPRDTAKLGTLDLGDLQLLQGDKGVLTGLTNAQRMQAPSTAIVKPGQDSTAAKIIISQVNKLTNDPADQPALHIAVLDKDGKPATDGFVTLFVEPEAADPDALPEVPGYQALLKNGETNVRLSPLAFYSSVRAEARIGEIAGNAEFPVVATQRPFVAVGAGGIRFGAKFNAGLMELDPLAFSVNFFARGSIFNDWLLTAAASRTGGYNFSTSSLFFGNDRLLEPADKFERFPLTGDSGSQGYDVNSGDPYFLRLERDANYLMYGRIGAGFNGITTNYTQGFDGLRGEIRGGNYYLNAFVAQLPNANVLEVFRGNDSSVYRLSGQNSSLQTPSLGFGVVGVEVQAGNETLTVVTTNPTDLGNQARRVLVRGNDYNLDYLSGTITLTRILPPTDVNGKLQFLEVRYAIDGTNVPALLHYGAQAGAKFGVFGVEATGLRFGPNANVLFGGAITAQTENLQARAEATFSGAPALAAALNYGAGNFGFKANYSERFAGYVNPNDPSTFAGTNAGGRSLTSSLNWGFSSVIALVAGLDHTQDFSKPGAVTSGNAGIKFSLGNWAFLLGADAKFTDAGITKTTELWGTLGAEVKLDRLGFGITQRVPFMGGASTYGDTRLNLSYDLSRNFSINLGSTFTYVPNGVAITGSLGTTGRFSNREIARTLGGNWQEKPNQGEEIPSVTNPEEGESWGYTNIRAGYETTNLSGDAGRVRVGLDTNIPLSKSLSVLLGADANYAPATSALTAGFGTGLRYNTEGLQADVAARYAITPQGLQQTYDAGGVFKLSNQFVVSPKVSYQIDPVFNANNVRDGGQFSLAAAYRGDDWSVLTNNTGRFGVRAPGTSVSNDRVEGEIQFGYEGFERFFLRANTAYRYILPSQVFTGQVGAGATWFITDFFGIGANATYQFSPSLNYSGFGFGLEGSLRVLPGVVFTLGGNIAGVDNLGSFTTAPGFYVRLDFKFDETTFGLGK